MRKNSRGRIQALRQACQALGGVEAGKGDVAYCLPVFDCLPVRLAFWEADEDFPPSLQFQWDRNTTDFIHFETDLLCDFPSFGAAAGTDGGGALKK